MTIKVFTFDQALGQIAETKRPNVLLGNGFSRACLDDTFAYDALANRAGTGSLSPNGWASFDVLSTSDFEVVMRGLADAARLVTLYAPESPVARMLTADGDALREVLLDAIARSHPDHPFEIDEDRYLACKRFLSHFGTIYTLNYDLLLYWALMHEGDPKVRCDDGFRKPEDDDDATYVVWDPAAVKTQNVYYLHGALHLFDGGADLHKYTWIKTGVRLIDQVREAMTNDLFPVFVAEGHSSEKRRKIRHLGYLQRGERSLYSCTKPMFIYGHSMAENDDHILRAIRKLPRDIVPYNAGPQVGEDRTTDH